MLCDFSDDCGDASDEHLSTCASFKDRCSFENGKGDFVEDDQDDFDWRLLTGAPVLDGCSY